MAEFAYTEAVPVRYRDLDPWDHVNNAVFSTYLEEARVGYLNEVIPGGIDSRSFVLAHVEMDYHAPVTHGADLTVAVRASDPGTSSLTLSYEVRADGEVAATAETTQVHLGGGDDPRPLPEDWLAAIRAFEPAL